MRVRQDAVDVASQIIRTAVQAYNAQQMLKIPSTPAQDSFVDSNFGKSYPFAGVNKTKHSKRCMAMVIV